MSKFENPYKRLEKINEELQPLEVIEKADFIGRTRRQIEEIKSKIFFLVIEKITIESCVKYFEKKVNKLKSTDDAVKERK